MPESKSWRNTPLGNVVILAAATIVVLAAVWLVGFARAENSAESGSAEGAGEVSQVDVPDSAQPAPEVGQQAPLFSAKTLTGEEFDLGALAGKPAWIIFNATWCSNCRAEIPDIQDTFDTAGDLVEIVSVYVSDTPSAVADYSTKLNLTFPQIFDSNNEIAALYRVMGLPTHYFIAGDGTVNQVRVGTLSPTQIEESLLDLGVRISQ